jgi:protein-S-isoprenylcysteine O-methyltransferase Ste14
MGIFCYVHVRYWVDEGQLKGIGLALQEGMLVALYLVRRRPKESYNGVIPWIVAVGGTFGGFVLRPNDDTLFGLDAAYTALALAGAAMVGVSTFFLGRSFGIVAANRGVKSSGAYRIVRHPIYASYLIGFVAYLLASFSLWNVLVIAGTVAFQLRRIHEEESVLMRDPEYRAYAQRTPYRLIPGIY